MINLKLLKNNESLMGVLTSAIWALCNIIRSKPLLSYIVVNKSIQNLIYIANMQII